MAYISAIAHDHDAAHLIDKAALRELHLHNELGDHPLAHGAVDLRMCSKARDWHRQEGARERAQRMLTDCERRGGETVLCGRPMTRMPRRCKCLGISGPQSLAVCRAVQCRGKRPRCSAVVFGEALQQLRACCTGRRGECVQRGQLRHSTLLIGREARTRTQLHAPLRCIAEPLLRRK